MESVVFVVEDDAQDGPDHVDAHRSTAYVAGGLVRSNFEDHTMYSTASVLHTIETDFAFATHEPVRASATPMWRCFSLERNIHAPYSFIPNNIPLDLKNPSGTKPR
jgi:hypothetical protein